MSASLKTTLGLAAILLVAAVGIAIYLINRRPAQDECTFLGWKQSIGVDLDVTVGKLRSAQVQLGITDSQIREFDDLLKDYGAKYEAICRDWKAGRINSAEYSCRRQNMDRALDSIRALERSLNTIESVKDVSVQKDIAIRSLANFKEFAGAGYNKNCTSAISVLPSKITFEDHYPERSIQISNSGNQDLTYALEEVPEAFVPVPPSGPIRQGGTVSVALRRSTFPVSNDKLTFYVRDNFDDRIKVSIEVSNENASLYESLGGMVNAIATKEQQPVGLREALVAVDLSTAKSGIGVSSGARYFYAAGVLQRLGKYRDAETAISIADQIDPGVDNSPNGRLFRGWMAYEQGNKQRAVSEFQYAKDIAPAFDDRIRITSSLMTAAAEYSSGNRLLAYKSLNNPDLHAFVRSDVGFSVFLHDEFGGFDALRASRTARIIAAVERHPIVISSCVALFLAWFVMRRLLRKVQSEYPRPESDSPTKSA
jgi:tetratricopeptide (TPR) repeat protein